MRGSTSSVRYRTVVLTLIWAATTALVGPTARAAIITEHISVTETGEPVHSAAWGASLSGDGRYAAFYSPCGIIVSDDANHTEDVFVRDRLFQRIELVSRSNAGEVGNSASSYPSISADAAFVAFCSTATNLVAGDANGAMDVFVRDRETGQTELVSLTTTGEQTNASSPWCDISNNGRYVVFQSEASNLIEGHTNSWPGVYIRDRELGTTSIASVSGTGEYSEGTSLRPCISGNGRYVAFRSQGNNLAEGDTNGYVDVFVRDLEAGTTERVSVADLTGEQANGPAACVPALSDDGRYVAFASYASNLVPGDANGKCDVFVRDRFLGLTELVSMTPTGAAGNGDSGGDSWRLSISADGRYVGFASRASNLVVGDTNGAWDVFVRDRQEGTTTLMSVSTEGELGNGDSGTFSVALSGDGLAVGFESSATNLIPLDTNGGPDVFVRGEQLAPRAPRLVIDNDATYATSPEVSLAIDPGDYDELRFRNEEEAWTAWEAAVTARSWTLSAGDGEKRVSLQGRAGADESLVNGDVILLDSTAPQDARVTINGGDATTLRHPVTLTLEATGAPEMRLRNEASEWSEWEPFAAVELWTLSDARGWKTVGFQVRDALGNTAPEVTDTIELVTFSDVPESYWAFAEVMACVDADVVAGFPEADYRPEQPVTRDQMAVFLARSLAGGDANIPAGPPDPTFSDVLSDYWAYDAIEYLAAEGVSLGYPEGDYRPAQSVDRAQMAVYIARSIATPVGEAGLADYLPPVEPTFTDVPPDHWAFRYVEYCAAQAIVHGYPCTGDDCPEDGLPRYEPDWVVTRGQMAVYVTRAFGLPVS